ncbi:MAG: serine hydrolase domain-containing protein [Anaerolineae bacterium]|jgi:CubicO group peptidase (beta-lactamase class C family)
MALRLPRSAQERIHDLAELHLGRTFTAASLVVLRGGEPLFEHTWGWVRPGPPEVPATPATRFDLASLTKLFTVTAFLGLVSQGQARLDQALVDVVPEFGAESPRPVDWWQDPHTGQPLRCDAVAGGEPVDPASVTFRHLLTHTSGLAPWRDVYTQAGPPPPPPGQPDSLTCRERYARGLAAICGYPFVDLPGRRVHYSDLGLILLGEAVCRLCPEGAAGLDQAIAGRVTGPLGLVSVVYNPLRQGLHPDSIAPTERDERWRGRRCWGEVHDENACGLGGVAGHAGLFATARDVAAFGQAWLETDARLGIEPELARLATSEQASDGPTRRGLGWALKSEKDSPAGDVLSLSTFGHTGFTGTSLWVDPARALVIALLTNRVYYGRDNEGIHRFRRTLHDCIAVEVRPC